MKLHKMHPKLQNVLMYKYTIFKLLNLSINGVLGAPVSRDKFSFSIIVRINIRKTFKAVMRTAD